MNFDINITICIEIIKYWYFYKSLPQLSINLSNFGDKKTRSGVLYKSLRLYKKRF